MKSNIDNLTVEQLLDMYDQYRKLQTEQSRIVSGIAKAKLLGRLSPELQSSYEAINSKLQRLSDQMTFSRPSVWMLYKYKAYAAEAQPILNMKDFRSHCSKPGYICTKRFTFLNQCLDDIGQPNLRDDDRYPDGMRLDEAINLGDISKLESTAEFINHWQDYEYHMIGSRVAKWENYR